MLVNLDKTLNVEGEVWHLWQDGKERLICRHKEKDGKYRNIMVEADAGDTRAIERDLRLVTRKKQNEKLSNDTNQAESAAKRLGVSWKDAMHYTAAITRWAAQGFPTRSQEEVGHIEAEICKPCKHYINGRCGKCRCKVNKEPAIVNKIKMATENCPLGKWNHIVDVVYTLGCGSRWDDNELRYSLRSVNQYFSDLRDIIIVGERPSWLRNVIHIPMDDSHKHNKDANLIEKVLAVCNAGVSSSFVRLSDDQLFLKPIHFYNMRMLCSGSNEIRPDKENDSNGKWRQRLHATKAALAEKGYATRNFDTHCPQPYSRELFLQVWREFDYRPKPGLTINTTYGNAAKVEFNPIKGKKATIEHPIDSKEKIHNKLKGKQFLGYNNRGLSNELREVLAELFPNKSRYEA